MSQSRPPSPKIAADHPTLTGSVREVWCEDASGTSAEPGAYSFPGDPGADSNATITITLIHNGLANMFVLVTRIFQLFFPQV